MLFRDVIELVTMTEQRNSYGEVEDVEQSSREVFANKKSIRQTEFYQAHAQGLKPEIMFEIRTFEYEDERIARYRGVTYYIIRTYSKNDEIMELICSRFPMG